MEKALLLLIFFNIGLAVAAGDIDNMLVESKAYLAEIKKLSDSGAGFDTSAALEKADQILPFIEDESFSRKKRSELLVIYSGIVGLYAERKKSFKKGKIAYFSTRRSLDIDPCSRIASIAFASSLIGINDTRWSYFAKKSLGISGTQFIKEIDFALQHLRYHNHDTKAKELMKKLKKIKR